MGRNIPPARGKVAVTTYLESIEEYATDPRKSNWPLPETEKCGGILLDSKIEQKMHQECNMQSGRFVLGFQTIVKRREIESGRILSELRNANKNCTGNPKCNLVGFLDSKIESIPPKTSSWHDTTAILSCKMPGVPHAPFVCLVPCNWWSDGMTFCLLDPDSRIAGRIAG